ncbi:MAG: flagellin N-terminal helical domain-containing protein [Planctomycetota bacterium]|jgi:flagellin
MSLIINHNISAMNTQRNLELSNHSLSKSLQKLSSGYKINVAADDPSGLIISEQLRSQTSSLERAVRNSQEASNVIGIAEGALIEINEMLRHLRGLAIHAANSGITASDQVRADQSELDSAVQTIDRIANTTKYSDQYLLNGSKSLIYDTNVVSGNALIDTGKTRLDQVFKRTGLVVGINYTGQAGSTPGTAAMTRQAQRGIWEAGSQSTGSEVDSTLTANINQITADQSFIVTGALGSRQFSFSSGTDIAQVVSGIENVAESTGVHASLIFANNATATVTGAGIAATNITSYDIYGMQTGTNTGAQGQLYFQTNVAGTIDVFSDVAGANLVASTTGATAAGTYVLEEQNDSGISGTVTTGAAVTTTAIGATVWAMPKAVTDATVYEDGDSGAVFSGWQLNGIEVGTNTDSEGRLYVSAAAGAAGAFNIYSDSALTNLVATGTDAAGLVTLSEANGSGLGGFVTSTDAGGTATLRPRLTSRLYSSEYGEDAYVRMQANKGKMWERYNSTTSSYQRLDSTVNPVTDQADGQDATVYVNGTEILIGGLDAEINTPVFGGRIYLEEGVLADTTIAQVGFDRGNASSSAGMMYTTTNLAVNAGDNSSENIENIRNGMQYQLGENDGDQARTVYAIPSMSVPNLGQVEVGGVNYTLQDVLGGGTASLSKDPVVAMKVISQAIDDVSSLRARLGAFQKNMLQTNINSLNVTMENITATESAIRDANMAYETSQFTKNQILTQAGTAMLAQANTVSQNVLQLLG